MRHDGLLRRTSYLCPNALGAVFLPLVLILALPACRTATTACNGAAASIPAPALTAAGGAVYAAAGGSVSALRASTGALAWRSSGGAILAGRPTPPVVAGDITIISTGPGTLVAYRISDGALAWHSRPVPRPYIAANNSPLPIVTLAGDVVYAAASPDSIAAWRAADGSLLWQSPPLAVPADPAYVSSYPSVPEPVVVAGIVYFSAGQSVHAVRAADGRPLWSSPALQLWSFYTPPTLADGRLFIVAHDGSLYALAAATGAVLWHARDPDATAFPDASAAAPPVVRDGIVYYVAVNGVRALAAATGKLLWHLPSDNPGAGPAPMIAGGVLYVATSGTRAPAGAQFKPDTLWALDARTGSVRWKAAIQQALGVPFLVDGDVLYTASPGAIAAWNIAGGMSLWQRTVQSGPASLQQVIFAGGVFYLSMDGMKTCGDPIMPAISARRAADGALLWHTSISQA